MNLRDNRRRAFTLIEALVVMAIVGLLIAIILPAVQAAREAARKAQCLNHLKQMGIALNGYESTVGAFPAATPISPHGWLLPFLDQSPLFNALNCQIEVLRGSSFMNSTVSKTMLQVFLCPSDGVHPDGGWTNYSGNQGGGAQKFGQNGFFPYQGVKAGDLLDGASQTVAFAETATGNFYDRDRRRAVLGTPILLIKPEQFDSFVEICEGLNAGTTPMNNGMKGSEWLSSGLSLTLYNHVLPMNSNNCTNLTTVPNGAFSAGSFHPGGVNVVFADGHAQFLKETIGIDPWRAIASRAGSDVVSHDGL